MQSNDRLDNQQPEGRTQVSAFFGSDEFITGFIYGLLVLLMLVIPAELFAEWWRKR
jgi:hypothetical protein